MTDKAFKNIVFTQKSASLERGSPFCRKIFNERLPHMSAPPFSQKRCSFEN